MRTIETNIDPFFGGQQYEGNVFSSLIKDHTDTLSKHYGHAGQKYIRYLVAVVNAPERKEKLIIRYREIRSQLSKGVENPYLLRSIDYFAVIQLSLEIASRILPELNITTNQITNAVQLILDRQRLNLQQGGDIDHRALSYVWDKIISEPERFEGKAYEYWGAKVSRRSSVSKVGYAFLPNKLEELLVKGGFNYRSSLQYFKANGWIWLDAKGELWAVTIKKEFDSEPNTKRCVVFDKDAALKAGILVENDSDEPSNKAPVLSLVPQPVMDELEPPEHLVEAFNAACDK